MRATLWAPTQTFYEAQALWRKVEAWLTLEDVEPAVWGQVTPHGVELRVEPAYVERVSARWPQFRASTGASA
ncbi:MAG: hypothetical protein FJ029_01735 [Actinobacteria bacterium]|nr:hypothetical protein [Actinomycetota bacterium]